MSNSNVPVLPSSIPSKRLSQPFLTSPRPRFRYYAVPKLSLSVLQNLMSFGVHRGNDIEKLESAMCDLHGVQHAVAMPQARVGIHLAILFLAAGKKKKVILSPYTIHDVINMVICAGAEPVFADIESGTCNISAEEIERLIDDETAAVMVTHLHGLACDMRRISEACHVKGVTLIEDCAQALGARVDGQLVGSFGEVGIFSYGRAKNINALFGGMLLTRNRELSRFASEMLSTRPYFPALRLLKQAALCFTTNTLFSAPWFPVLFSRLLRYSHLAPIDPFNNIVRGERNPTRRPSIPIEMLARMTPMQARLALSQLSDVDDNSDIRLEYAKVYHKGLSDLHQLTIPPLREDRSHIYLAFPIQVTDRESLLTYLLKGGRDVTRQYLANNANAECWSEFKRSCPCATETANSTLLMPTYPGYGIQEVERNVALIREYFSAKQTDFETSPVLSTSDVQSQAPEESDGTVVHSSAFTDEGKVLLHYVLGRTPDDKLVNLYAYAVAQSELSPKPLRIPHLVRKFPRLLRLIEPVETRRSKARPHLLKARLVEASRIGNLGVAPLYYDYHGSSFFQTFLALAGVGMLEAMALPFRLAGGFLWRR